MKDSVIPFQTRAEFSEWETNLMFLLKSKGLWKHIKTMRPTGEELADAAFTRDKEAYKTRCINALKDNDQIVGIIGKSVVSDIKKTIKNMEYADEIMDFLTKYNSENGQSENNGIISKKMFYSRCLKEGEHIGKFMAGVYDDGQKLKLSDIEIIEFLFAKGTLPDQWGSFLDGIKFNDHYKKNWFNLREALLDHGISKGYNGESSIQTGQARAQANQKEVMELSDTRQCYFCKETGHIKPNCTKYAAWKKKKGVENKDAPRTWQGDRNSKSANEINRNLFAVQKLSYADAVKTKTLEPSKRPAEDNKEKMDPVIEYKTAAFIDHDEDNDSISQSDIVSLWKDDSGATDHCCNDKNLFSTMEKCKINLATAGEAHVITAEGVGTIDFIDEQGRPSVLEEVLFIPTLRHNLFSSTKAVIEGNATHSINKKEVNLRDTENKVILKGVVQPNASIIIKMRHDMQRIANEVQFNSDKLSGNEMKRLHIRLGHRHLSAFDRDCEFCLSIKTTQQKYRKYSNKDIIKGRIFADLMGPFGGDGEIKGYIATIVVDSSDETIALVLDQKDDFFEEWSKIWKKLEVAYAYKIKVFQCDGGGEFINKRMLKWLEQQGIQLVQSNAYAHSQNSIVERRNRTLRDSALTMCLMANMNFDVYWPSSITCAAYLLNMQKPSRTEIVPYVAKTGKTLDLKYLRPYGHTGFMHIPAEKRSKNDERGVKVRLLGYTGNGYYIEDQKGNFHCSRDIRWLKESTSLKLNAVYESSDDSDCESDGSSQPEKTGVHDELEQLEPVPRNSTDSDESSFHTARSGDNERDQRLDMESKRDKIDPSGQGKRGIM
jgi:hypothetical protein